jgi:osmotically-inducible protein OsmY
LQTLVGVIPRIPTDEEIAERCHRALAVHTLVPHLEIGIAVHAGWVTLSGRVAWEYQKTAAEQAIARLIDVAGVTDKIEVKPPVSASEIRDHIEAAFKRSAEIDARGITIEAREGKVTLGGTVPTQAEKEQARQAALTATGVLEVDDHIMVAPHR